MNRAFSLVEVLAAIAIIGIVTFLAIPNIIRIKTDGEQSLAISRAEGLNMAMASYIQANGYSSATSSWAGLGSDTLKYNALAPYLAYAPAYTNYMPADYSVTFGTLTTKVTLSYLTSTNTISY